MKRLIVLFQIHHFDIMFEHYDAEFHPEITDQCINDEYVNGGYGRPHDYKHVLLLLTCPLLLSSRNNFIRSSIMFHTNTPPAL